MIDLITTHRQSIQDLCRTYGVRRLNVFGSTTTGALDPATSDIDLLVDLGEYVPGTAVRYLDLINELEDLLGRPVQMVTEPSIRNLFFARWSKNNE